MAKAKKVNCPKCGKSCDCYYAGDVNAEPRFDRYQYIVDEYCLACPHCGHEERKREDGGQAGYDDKLTDCPFCGVSCRDHQGISFLERTKKITAARKKAGHGRNLCPRCGKRKMTCEYLGDRGGADHHHYTWDHRCPCGFHDQLTRLVHIKRLEEDDQPEILPTYGPGKKGGCPGHKG